MLTADEMIADLPTATKQTASAGGLIVAGSYVDKTTRQLARAKQLVDVRSIELSVRQVLDGQACQPEIERVLALVEEA